MEAVREESEGGHGSAEGLGVWGAAKPGCLGGLSLRVYGRRQLERWLIVASW